MNHYESCHPASELLTQGILLNRITNRIRQSLDLPEILSATVAEMRSFLNTDRVKVYRFEADGSGEVIAESIDGNRLPSLLGLHFPANDIPLHARELFVKARTRSIVDVQNQQIILNRLAEQETTGDLTSEEIEQQPIEEILQRAVDPCHVEYLTRMGVQSSLVVPILHQQALWGLLVSHHAQPKTFSSTDLQIVQMVADQVSVAISHAHLLDQARSKARREALINQISTLLHAPLNIQQILQAVLEEIVPTVEAVGGRLYLNPMDTQSISELYLCGTQPRLKGNANQTIWLEHHPFWQSLMVDGEIQSPSLQGKEMGDLKLENESSTLTNCTPAMASVEVFDDLYQEASLTPIIAAFRQTSIRGMIVMSLRYGSQALGCLTLFRKEIDTDILWAGRFDGDSRSDRVRDSFEAWRELRKGQARPWSWDEIELVQSLGTHLAMALMQNRLYLWEREHRLLVEMRNQELKAARMAAEEASRLKSDFLSSTSHELRTPLASTLNYLKLLKEGFYDNEEELKEYIYVAHQSAENLVAIINDVLDIAKIEAGRMNVNFEMVNLPELIAELQRMFSIDSRRKKIPLIIQCEVENVWADTVKLRQVFTNLLSNAFKFTHQGEIRLWVRPADQTPSKTGDSQVVEISVQDSGIGIEPSQGKLVFEPFVQADGSIKRRYGGTGLGLTVCKRLVKLMGGEIWLESAGFNQGTTVTFTVLRQ
jgi:light-regulated signal transduction histidine kinase (bacteriophytochrome)